MANLKSGRRLLMQRFHSHLVQQIARERAISPSSSWRLSIDVVEQICTSFPSMSLGAQPIWRANEVRVGLANQFSNKLLSSGLCLVLVTPRSHRACLDSICSVRRAAEAIDRIIAGTFGQNQRQIKHDIHSIRYCLL